MGERTRLVEWRGGQMEFANLGSEYLARSPWWVVRYRGACWDARRWSYVWIDYVGVPHLYLTKKRALERAKAFRKQYGGPWPDENGKPRPLEVEVVRVGPIRRAPRREPVRRQTRGRVLDIYEAERAIMPQ